MKKKEMKELINLYRIGVSNNKMFMDEIGQSLRNLRLDMKELGCSDFYIVELDKIIQRMEGNL